MKKKNNLSKKKPEQLNKKPQKNVANSLEENVALKEDTTKTMPKVNELKAPATLVAENNDDDATSNSKDASTTQSEAETGQTLVFDIEDFDMKTAVTSAYEAAEETKKTGLKKVLDFVKSVKEGETGLGGLREAKNNLLSIKQKEKSDENSK